MKPQRGKETTTTKTSPQFFLTTVVHPALELIAYKPERYIMKKGMDTDSMHTKQPLTFEGN